MGGYFNPDAYKKVWLMGFLDISARLKGGFILDRTKGLTTGLEIGCGAGVIVGYLRSKGKKVVGVDFSTDMIKLAKKTQNGGKFAVMDGEKLAFKDNSFEFVYCLNVLHHMYNYRKALKELERVASKKVLICEPNYRNPIMWSYVNTLAKEYDKNCRFILPEEFPKKFGNPMFTRLGTHYWLILEKKRK